MFIYTTRIGGDSINFVNDTKYYQFKIEKKITGIPRIL